jgi:hypothetical protein
MSGMIHAVIEFLNLFFAGVLAGEEFVICYGVRTVGAVRHGALLGSRHFIRFLGSGCGDGMKGYPLHRMRRGMRRAGTFCL